MDKYVRLFITGYAFSEDNATHFLLPGKEVIVEGAEEVLSVLLRRCNGYRTAEEIVVETAQETGHEEADLWGIVGELLEHQILVDATTYYLFFHQVSCNPMPFQHWISEEDINRMLSEGKSWLANPVVPQSSLERLLDSRESVRDFSGEPLSEEEIHRLTWAIYGRIARSPKGSLGVGTVPSGGALYPLRVFLLKRTGEEVWGCARVGSEGIDYMGTVSQGAVAHAFLDDPTLLRGADVIYILTCEFLQTSQKYSNRGYRFALLEAGHAAQNAYLWCVEQGLGVVEIGGFHDEALAELVELPYPFQAPITTLLIGRRSRVE